MSRETDDTVRLRGWRRRAWPRPGRLLPVVAGSVAGAVLATTAAWWALGPPPAPPQPSPAPSAVLALAPAPSAIVAPAPAPLPAYVPPLATEAQILADQPERLAVYAFAAQPAVIVLQFPSLGEQARTLNRAAALLEKRGYPRDRVLPWAELNARIAAAGESPDTFYYGHDYSAPELVRFFALAPDLDREEQNLRSLVAQLGWDRPGAVGALISLVRQSADLDPAARATILRHELSHGAFFTDPQYSAYCQRFWDQVLTPDERAKLTAFLEREGYDPAISDLIVNEAQAYLAHTPDRRFFNAADVGLPEARIEQLRRLFVAGMPPGWLRELTLGGPPPAMLPVRGP